MRPLRALVSVAFSGAGGSIPVTAGLVTRMLKLFEADLWANCTRCTGLLIAAMGLEPMVIELLRRRKEGASVFFPPGDVGGARKPMLGVGKEVDG